MAVSPGAPKLSSRGRRSSPSPDETAPPYSRNEYQRPIYQRRFLCHHWPGLPRWSFSFRNFSYAHVEHTMAVCTKPATPLLNSASRFVDAHGTVSRLFITRRTQSRFMNNGVSCARGETYKYPENGYRDAGETGTGASRVRFSDRSGMVAISPGSNLVQLTSPAQITRRAADSPGQQPCKYTACRRANHEVIIITNLGNARESSAACSTGRRHRRRYRATVRRRTAIGRK